ncbi:nicotinate (nicotinamide) nucleotide adenylyltransferase [Prevotella sp. MA2016]|uniref:nicotinate (nicotinamide) nucleotide adenylyltransferase n=1 Tax=Prevotella sp. MA2016 TaxID=1408310 RepID=UPI00048BEAD4|nr:nicotinate (nicotinamide) nucleotide adenylyltransferase [Prevotella sp. MA2016]
MIRTGIFGGSFNPIHNGHISLARQLREKAGLDEVWLMVSPQNPLKATADLLDDQIRMEMARLAIEGETGIKASDYEMHLPKPSYTWNTLQALKQDYPDREFVLMIGGDNWQLFDKWYHADDIRENFQIVVYPRRGAKGGVEGLDLIDISSTEIRQLVKAGKPIDHLVPKAVAEYITRHKLYA